VVQRPPPGLCWCFTDKGVLGRIAWYSVISSAFHFTNEYILKGIISNDAYIT